MNNRLQKKKIKEIVYRTLEKIDISLDIHIQTTQVNMIYDFIKNQLIIDVDRIREARNEMITPVPLEDYIKALVLHEVGHYLDRDALWASIPRALEIRKKKRETPYFERTKDLELFQVDIEEHEVEYTFEETAWNNAAVLNEKFNVVGRDSFEKVRFESLLSYTAVYNRDLLIYQALLKQKTGKQLAV
ncbi:hypothetical protein [Thalassobacillus devorans]|uniref:hypothetical protein n=1 Tax=Thalassobacillus devorans TaxID=279813 RepID=UPI000491E9B4|nr:hypothetical protein [Thalassobacillus devorans]